MVNLVYETYSTMSLDSSVGKWIRLEEYFFTRNLCNPSKRASSGTPKRRRSSLAKSNKQKFKLGRFTMRQERSSLERVRNGGILFTSLRRTPKRRVALSSIFNRSLSGHAAGFSASLQLLLGSRFLHDKTDHVRSRYGQSKHTELTTKLQSATVPFSKSYICVILDLKAVLYDLDKTGSKSAKSS